MAKNRNFPFGYCMKNGKVLINQTEAEAVKRIFSEYLNGLSFLKIAELMENEKIRYFPDSDKWNKNMVKRIIENEKYLGKGDFPQIIDDETFSKANENRLKKASSLSVIPNDLQEIRKLAYCAECGERLTRTGGNTRSEKWDCKNPECEKFGVRITDQMIIGAVLNVFNAVIANPNMLDNYDEISEYIPTSEITKKQNEINQMSDSAQIDFERVKAEIFSLAQLKYSCCTYAEKPQKSAEIKALLADKKQLNNLDIGLLRSCVQRILISRFCTIEVEVIGGIKIKNITERNEENGQQSQRNGDPCES